MHAGRSALPPSPCAAPRNALSLTLAWSSPPTCRPHTSPHYTFAPLLKGVPATRAQPHAIPPHPSLQQLQLQATREWRSAAPRTWLGAACSANSSKIPPHTLSGSPRTGTGCCHALGLHSSSRCACMRPFSLKWHCVTGCSRPVPSRGPLQCTGSVGARVCSPGLCIVCMNKAAPAALAHKSAGQAAAGIKKSRDVRGRWEQAAAQAPPC